jgi:L-iditol 2-dehydrogenase
MKALVYLGPGSMELRDIDEPAGEVLVRVLGSGLCGTDLKTYMKGHHMFVPPTVLGHECYGKIESATADSGFLAGEFVAIAPYLECGICPVCLKGNGQLCGNKSFISGGCFAEYVAADSAYAKRAFFRISEARIAYALVEPLACVLNGIGKLRLDGGRKALVVGGGPMGSLFGAVLEARGLPFAFVEVNPGRAAILSNWGWKLVPSGEVPAREYDQVVLTVNKPELVSTWLAAAADGGNLLLFSGFSRQDRATIDPYDTHYREVSMTGSYGYARSHFVEALGLISTSPESFERLVTHRLPLARGVEAMGLLQRGEAMKIVIEP